MCFQSCGRQDTHNDIQDVLGQNYGVPDDIDEEELLGELDDLEADMAFEAEHGAASGTVPSYLQVPAQLCPPVLCYLNEVTRYRLRLCIIRLPAEQKRRLVLTLSHRLCPACQQDVDLPEAPGAQHAQPVAISEQDFGMPAVPQRN